MSALQSVFRFAPSPNGYLHLGHAYSALLNQQLAREAGGRLLLRIEDIDVIRCRPELVEAAFEDLDWLGISFEQPVLRQSGEFNRYRAEVARLHQRGLIYRCFCSRKEIQQAAGSDPPRDPDGAPCYPGTCRGLDAATVRRRTEAGHPYALRLDNARAREAIGNRALSWQEWQEGEVPADPSLWGDAVIARKETPTSYHLAVVLDDAMQGITDVVRGRDLYFNTALHRLLQALIGLPAPRYRHHGLITDADGQKLAKSRASTPLRQLRAEGVSAADVRRSLGF